MKKRSLTLIEIMIALGIVSLLLAVMFPHFRETMRMKKQIEIEKSYVFAKAHVQERLATLFSKTTHYFKTIQEKDEILELQFKFDNGYDDDKNFRGDVTGYLWCDKGTLRLKISGKKEAVREEILLEGVKNAWFDFTSVKEGKFDTSSTWEKGGIPLFFVLNVSFQGKKEDAFYFRLNTKNRLEYPGL
ncbi:type II secretion system protein [Simkania sp.]|uniref:type II secretion system protein n=1 Tax=Simkania sp. TaxID=34094 RepID=UPI003B51688A